MSNKKLVLPDYLVKYYNKAKERGLTTKDLIDNAPKEVLAYISGFNDNYVDVIIGAYRSGYISEKDAKVSVIFPDKWSTEITFLRSLSLVDLDGDEGVRHTVRIYQLPKEGFDNYAVGVIVEEVRKDFPWALQFATCFAKYLESNGVPNLSNHPYISLIPELLD